MIYASSEKQMSHCIGKPSISIGENKGADQPHSNRKAYQRLCFHYMDSKIPLLASFKISSFYLAFVTVLAGLCQTWSEPKLLVFSSKGLNVFKGIIMFLILSEYT